MKHPIRELMDDVAAFHRATGCPADKTAPEFPDKERVQLRIELINEEWRETLVALQTRNMTSVADGLADLIYVAVGTALELGIPLDRVWQEVQRSNMSKVDPDTGEVRKREDGKILKGSNWQPPDIRRAIYGEDG